MTIVYLMTLLSVMIMMFFSDFDVSYFHEILADFDVSYDQRGASQIFFESANRLSANFFLSPLNTNPLIAKITNHGCLLIR